jgi:aspartate carbamoyltransferase regulatory subunit
MSKLIILFFMVSMSISQKETIKSVDLTYQTRGMRKFLHITPDSIVVTINEETHQYKTTPAQWEKIINALEKVNLAGISSLKRPSKRAAFDGAMAAQLVVLTSKKKYESSGFDHNKPNIVLVKTIDYMKLTLSKTEQKDF